MDGEPVDFRKTVPPRYASNVFGLPKKAMVFTNSERSLSWCKRRWFYQEGLGLQTTGSAAMSFGSCVHTAMEAVFNYWKAADKPVPKKWITAEPGKKLDCFLCEGSDPECLVCEGQNLCPYSLALEYMESQWPEDEWEEQAQRLHDVIRGYFHRYGAGPMRDFRVVDVEKAIAFPVLDPRTGKPFESVVNLVPMNSIAGFPQTWRIARAGEESISEQVTMPWYQCCRMDAVLENRKTGDVWVHEFKTSANPTTYGRDLHLDTQIPGYIRALQYAVSQGYLGGNRRVVGYQWDVLGSRKHTKPKILASGKVSTAKNARIASWHWIQALSDPNVIGSLYTDDEIRVLKERAVELRETVDTSLYHREFGTFSEELGLRYAAELYTAAKRFSKMRNNVAAVDPNNDLQVSEHFPRTAVCRIQGHGCSYKSTCLNDTLEARQLYENRTPLFWVTAETAPKKQSAKESYQCPF